MSAMVGGGAAKTTRWHAHPLATGAWSPQTEDTRALFTRQVGFQSMVPEATRVAQSVGTIGGGGLPESAEPRPSSAAHSTAASILQVTQQARCARWRSPCRAQHHGGRAGRAVRAWPPGPRATGVLRI